MPDVRVPYATAAQIEYVGLNRPDLAVNFMQKALSLGRSDPTILMPAAELYIRMGNLDAAVPLLAACIKANQDFTPHVLNLLLEKDRSDLAIKICQDNVAHLASIFEQLPAEGRPATPTQVTSRDVLQNELARRCEQPDTEAWVLAMLGNNALDRNDPASAYKYFQRALGKEYSQVDWRLGLARALVQTGQTDAAIVEIRACERMAPQRDDVRNYLQEILNHSHPEAMRSLG